MRKTAVCLVVLFAALGLCGCGGGGDSGAATPATPAAPAPVAATVQPLKTSQIHAYQAGDQYVYAVSGTVTTSSGSAPISGTFAIQILSGTKTDPLNGIVCFDMYRNLRYTISGSATQYESPFHWYGRQLSNGTVLYYGQNTGAADAWITAPASGYYSGLTSPVALGQTSSGSVTFSDGSTWENSISIAPSTAIVSVPAGDYEAYVVTLESTRTSGTIRTVENDTQWVVPGLGMVQERVNYAHVYVSNVLQRTLSYTARLTSTTVTY